MFYKRLSILGLCLLTTFPAVAKDTLRLKNGDVLSGTITGFDATGAALTTPYGTFNIPMMQISGIESPRYAMPEPEPEPIAVIEPPVPAPAPVEALATTEPAAGTPDEAEDKTGLWGAEWSGNANAGLNFDRGNSDSESYNADAKVKGQWDKHRVSFGVDYDYEKDNDTLTTDERQLNGAYDYFFAEKWFWQNQLSLEQDKIEDLNLRTQFNSGLGYQFYDRDDLTLDVVLGPGYRHEDYDAAGGDTSSMTAHWSLGYEQKFYDDWLRVYHNHDLSAPTEDMNAYLFESDSGVKIPLKAGIIATAGVEFDWNNDPAQGNVEDDTTYSLKLGYEWE